MFCSSCGVKVALSARFCSRCGKPVDAESEATLMDHEAGFEGETIAPASTPHKPPSAPVFSRNLRTTPTPGPLTSSDPIGGGRFAPGQVLGDRYRIVALAGRGGMGEVYRAEDLTLSQVVAIKFLPQQLSQDAAALSRFHSEVRVARQVSHPNVCRVFDIGEADGSLFLTMEYVDGEDLASVVRRIGRLSPDKATEIARQICAGLAAAHDRGVIHRDLKPANVMLDGTGKIRITDFGLAGVAAGIKGEEARAGTPAYMAPEQLAGREVTPKSDIYSLGLILYEILTGKRAFEAATLAELVKVREAGRITNPSTLIRDLDPLIERVILRCLESDPGKRPVSALQVAAALPGGDPLAAALAAGETPSPEMVAASGQTEGIAPRVALMGLAAVVAGVALTAYIELRVSGLEMIHPALPPEALQVKAQEIIGNVGYSERPMDQVAQFYFNMDFTEFVRTHDLPRPDWPKILRGQPQILLYAYRQSPVYLDAQGYQGLSLTPGVVQFDDPPAIQSGMVNLILDTQGRLTYFQAIPKEFEASPAPAGVADYKPLFAAAQLDLTSFHPVEPQWVSLAAFDSRVAWEGTWPGSGRPLRIEAAAWRGKPVYFKLFGPWTTPDRMQYSNTTAGQRASQIIRVVLAVLLLIGGTWIARRNYIRGKGDPQGGLRLAGTVFVVELAVWICRQHFVPTLSTLGRLVLAVSTGLFLSATVAMLYLALEPYVRRHWPQAIVSWSRLTTGRIRDPLVGRDVLWGVILGISWVLVVGSGLLLRTRVGGTPDLPSTSLLLGGRQLLGIWLLNIVQGIVSTLEFFFVSFVLRIGLRNRWLAAGGFVAIWAASNTLQGEHPEIMGPVWILVFSIAALAVTRFGLITLAIAVFTANVLLSLPYTLDFSLWYASSVSFVLLGFVAIAIWGCYLSLAGQNLWKGEAFE